MKLSRRFSPAADLFTEFDQFFNRAFSRPLLPGTRRSTSFGVYEADDAWHLRTDLPGFRKEEVSLRLEEGILHLSAEHDEEGDHPFHSKIERTFRVPDNIDVTAIGAKLENGVLDVTLPKAAEEKPDVLRVEVQ